MSVSSDIPCGGCKETKFPTSATRNYHEQHCTAESPISAERLYCDECDILLPDGGWWHIRKFHPSETFERPKNENSVWCEACKVRPPTQDDLEEHLIGGAHRFMSRRLSAPGDEEGIRWMIDTIAAQKSLGTSARVVPPSIIAKNYLVPVIEPKYSYSCCGKAFSHWVYFLQHAEMKHEPPRSSSSSSSEEKPERTCWICGSNFGERASWELHFCVQDPFTRCCNAKFMTLCEYALHTPSCTSEPHLFPCPKCPTDFRTETELHFHNTTKHPEIHMQTRCLGTYKCVDCNTVFSSGTALNKHLRQCKRIPPSMTACDGCGEEFATRDTLLKHVLEDCKKVICKKCGKGFRRELDRNSHAKTSRSCGSGGTRKARNS